jgi:cysteine desulfurase
MLVDTNGMGGPDDVRNAITKETILITIMHANNEVGSIQPISEIRKIARSREMLFHTDCIQTLGNGTLPGAGIEFSRIQSGEVE